MSIQFSQFFSAIVFSENRLVIQTHVF